MAPPRVDPIPCPLVGLLPDLLNKSKNWEAAALFATYCGELRRTIEGSPVLLMRFVASPKIALRMERYNFSEISSVTAFWLEQLRITPSFIRAVKTGARGGRLYEITLPRQLEPNALGSLPRGLVKVAKGVGFELTVPSRKAPKDVRVVVEPVPLQISVADIVAAVGGYLDNNGELAHVSRVYNHGVPTPRLEASLKMDFSKESLAESLPGLRTHFRNEVSALVNPWLLESWSFTLWVGGALVRVSRQLVCSACAAPDHRVESCPSFQRLMGSDMPTFVLLGKPRTTEGAPAVEPAPAREVTMGEASTKPGPSAPPKAAKAAKEKGGKGKGKATKGKGKGKGKSH
jgi:hypothetical protein